MSQMTHCGQPIAIELSHCTMTHRGHKPSEPGKCTVGQENVNNTIEIKTGLLSALCSTEMVR